MLPPALPAEPSAEAAGFWPRAVAWLIDATLVALPVWALLALTPGDRLAGLTTQWRALGGVAGQALIASAERGEAPLVMLQSLGSPASRMRQAMSTFSADAYAAAWPALALFVVIGLLYWPLQEAGRHHATFGKRALGLEVEGARGARLSPGLAYRRHVAGGLSWLTLNIGHLLAANEPGHRALHDRIAGTRVVWQANARRTVPAWGWGLVAIACLLPLVIAVKAAASLSAAMQAALGI